MNVKKIKRISKFLSYVLRHHPESIGIKLDEHGWASVAKLLKAANKNARKLTLQQLKTVVKENDKKRFSFSSDSTRIRANQGHSISVKLGYRPVTPPAILYHGTAEHRVESIKKQGLLRGKRHHVHLSPDKQTANKVGARYGKAVIIEIKAKQMHSEGFRFYLSDNNIWLTEYVPPDYLIFDNGK